MDGHKFMSKCEWIDSNRASVAESVAAMLAKLVDSDQQPFPS